MQIEKKFTKKGAVKLILTVGLIVAAILLLSGIFSKPKENDISLKVKTKDDRIELISALGWEVDPDSETERVILLPEDFPDVLEKYNELQIQQGFDLKKYAGTELTLYSYEVRNYPDNENVLCNLYVYKNKVVGADIHSTAFSGFIQGLL